MSAFDKIKKWMFGDETTARKRAERHQPKVSIGLATAESGDRQDDIDGLDVGGVIWPVEQGTHGGVGFISSQCFYATYDKKKKQVWLLDNETGTRHPGALPLIPGDTVFPEPDTGGRGLVIRTALFGNDGLKRNVFIPLNAKLEAHHEQPDPPINSSQVFDEDGRHGGLHYLTRVRLMVTKLCLGVTDKLTEVFAPMLNFTRNGDGTPAHGVATFRASNAMLSHEADGPLCPADDNQHIGGETSDKRKLHSGGIDRSRALYGDTAAGIPFSPKEFVLEPWQRGSRDAFPGRVEEREDLDDFHINLCGKRARGKKKWMEWKPKAAPPERPPTDTPPKRPPPVTGPPGTPIPPEYPPPAMARIPAPPVTSQPTNTGPSEEEQPSLRGIARPDFDPPTGTGFEEAHSHGVGTQDEIWKRATGMTQREFFDLRRVSHDVAQGVAAMTLPEGVSNSPVLMTAYLQSTFAQDSKGQWYGRRGYAPGSQTLMPGGLEGHMAYKDRHGSKLTQSHELTRLLLNYKQGSYEVKTLLAMGARTPSMLLPASGWYFRLDYTDGHDVPALDIRSTDSAGLDASTGRVVKINGTAISSSTGDVVGPSSAVDNALARFDGVTGKLIQKGDLVLDDVSGGYTKVHTKDNGAGSNSNGLRLDVGAATATAGGIQIGNSNATAVDISKSGVTTTIKGPTVCNDTLASGHTTVTATEDAAAINAGVDATDGPYEKTYWGDHSTAGTGTAETIIAIRKPAADACIALYVEIEADQSADASNTHVSTHVVSYYDKAGTLTYNAVVTSATGGTLPQTITFDASGNDMRVRITDDSNVYRVAAKVRVKWRTNSA